MHRWFRFVGCCCNDLMDFNYLRYLAKVGASHIHPYEKRGTDILLRELKLHHGQRVLEIGCGTGGTFVKICGRYNVQMYAVDRLDDMLAAARKRIRLTGLSGKVCLFKGNLAALPFRKGSFDRVYAESVLGILSSEEVEAVLEEIYRLLVPGGIVVLNDAIWKDSTSIEQVRAINAACLEDFGLLQASAEGWRLDEWTNTFRRQGFQVRSRLIEDYVESDNDSTERASGWRELASEGMTRGQKLMGYFNRGLRSEKKRYEALLERHRDDGKYIEARIFVLSKLLTQPGFAKFI